MADGAPSRPDVFLSYAREDEARVGDLATALDQRGFSVFWDREVPPGRTWHNYIGEALANARCVVVAWSGHSIASPWVLEEASEGKDRNVLVPVLFETVQPPFGFRAIQAASLIDWNPGRPSPAFDSLLAAVQRIVGGQVGSGTGAGVELRAPPQAAPSVPLQRTRLRAMAVGLLAVGGGSAFLWWSTQPEPIAPAPGTFEPEMVLVPAGDFLMGSLWDDEHRDVSETPQRKVTIAEPFWVGKYEVTFAEWDACVAAGGCNRKVWDWEGWGRDDRPVVNVSWIDAKEYVGWLSNYTGAEYRLLSEAEWEYVARAGSVSVYWWGDDIGRNNANCDGCGSEWDNTKTAPVGSFGANDFGLHDTVGNVSEWVEDCWHDGYFDAPTDGSAWTTGCDRNVPVRRGGSWDWGPVAARSAARSWHWADLTDSKTGFRVARTAD